MTIPQWPTATGKTLETVKQYCENAVMNSEPGKVCKVIPDFDFDIYVAQCVEDIKVRTLFVVRFSIACLYFSTANAPT